MSDNTIHVHLKIGVPSENTADFMALMDELVERARQEQGTLVYEWYMEDDGVTWHTVERYADGAQPEICTSRDLQTITQAVFSNW